MGAATDIRHTAEERRHTADERRDEVIEAAFDAFAETGLDGTSTEDIARRAGISQPYLFRLFGTKKELFLAAVDRCMSQTHDWVERAINDCDSDGHLLDRMGRAYYEVIADRRRLKMQMQAYAACDDPDVARAVREGFGRLVSRIQAASGASDAELSRFIGRGMLLNVMASMGVLESDDPWAVALREGCMEDA
jgi:AcrR family transcriptional regulator